jgi:hypothetical protein
VRTYRVFDEDGRLMIQALGEGPERMIRKRFTTNGSRNNRNFPTLFRYKVPLERSAEALQDFADLDFFEEVGDFLASRFRVIDCDLPGFVGAFADVLGGVDGVVAHDFEGVLGTIGGFYDDGFAVFTHLCNGARDGVHAVFAYFINLNGGLLRALDGVVRDDFGAFGKAMECILGANSGGIGAVDCGAGNEVKGVLRAVGGFDGYGLGAGVDFSDRAVNGGDYIFVGVGWQQEQRSEKQKTDRGLEHGVPPQGRYRI